MASSKFVSGIGFLGEGKYNPKEHKKIHDIWVSIIRRCYSEKEQARAQTYIGCTTNESWHNFQNFAEWYEQNYVDGWYLDKDILIKGNKIYGPDTCCFVPQKINTLFLKSNKTRGLYPIGVRITAGNKFQTSFNINCKHKTFGTYATVEEAFNVYKIEKEKYIREIAEEWRDKISQKVYEALINYKVEITD